MAGNRFNKKYQNSVFGKVVEKAIEDAQQHLNAIEFIESPQGLDVRLYPVQRLIVKAIFGVPFDFKEGKIDMYDPLRTKKLRTVTESEYLHIAHEENRCNIGDWRDIPARGFEEAAIFAGRRGGKSQVVSAIAAYSLYKLLNIKSPQEYFGLVPGSPIEFTFLAQDEEGASRLFDKLREDVNRAPFFNPYIKSSKTTELTFVSESDRGKRDVTGTIDVKSYPCTTNSARGPSSIFLAFDEFAHFRSAKGSSSDEVYGAATPATANFHHAEWPDGSWIHPDTVKRMKEENSDKEYNEYQDSLILSISSPLTKVGKMYELHNLAMRGGASSGIFTMRVSTAEMNPTVLASQLEKEYRKNPLVFRAEFGGEFLESSETYVPNATIRACTDVQFTKPVDGTEPEPIESTARVNAVSFHPDMIGRQFFWGIDLGMSHDATALAIAHLEFTGGNKGLTLVYDYIDRMMVGEKFEGPGITQIPGAEKYVDYKVLPLEDIMVWLKYMNELLPCFRGATDQHGGQQMVQTLEINQIHNVELLNLTNIVNSQMAYALRGYMVNGLCRFPYVPRFMRELRLVEAEYVNKYQIRVQAPEEKNSHDDMVDAVQLCAFLAQRWIQEEGGLKIDPTGSSIAIQEQMNKPAAPILGLDGVAMRDLQIMQRMKKFQQNMGGFDTPVVTNPFFRRRR
jgi:hypothetical protein